MKTLTEDIVDALAGYIEAELPAKLAAITAAAGDGITLEDLREVIVGERLAIDWPACWILARTVERELDENRNAYFNQFPLGFWRHRVDIILSITDPNDPVILRRRLYRYVLGVTQVINDHEHESALWVRAQINGHAYDQVFQHDEQTLFKQDAWIFLEVSRED